MAQDIEVSIKVDGSQSERALGTLKTQLREAQNEVNALSDKFGATSVQAVNAARKAAELKDRIGDAKALTDAFNPDAKFKALSASLGGVAGGFAAVQGGMNLLGVESSATEEALLKVQSAMALSQGAQAVGESVDSFRQLGTVIKSTTIFQQISTQAQRLWNLTMSANPIGAVVLAITALLTAGYALVNWYKSSSDETKKNTQAVSSNSSALDNQRKTADKTAIAIKKNGDYQIEMAKASGASAEAVRNLELKLIDEQIAFANSSRELAKNTYYKNKNALASLEAAGAEDELIAAQKETTQKALEEFGKQTKNLNDANAEKIQLIRNHNVEKKQAETNHNKEVQDEAKKAAETAKQERIRIAKEEAEALKAFQDDVLKNQQQMNVDKVNAEIQEKLDEKTSQEERLQGISDQVDAIDALNQKEIDNAKIAADKQIAVEQTLSDAKRNALDTGLNILLQFAGKNKAVALGILAIQKGLAIADVVVGATKAIALAKASMAPTPLNPAFLGPGVPNPSFLANLKVGATSMIATKIGAATSIASILAAGISSASSITAGGGGGSTSSGGGGGSISTPATVAPNVNVVGASRTNAIAETIAQQGQQPIKAYVVANDVTTQQGLNRSIVTSASIG
jgi:hypothetical protein